jgi:hypothetical protein
MPPYPISLRPILIHVLSTRLQIGVPMFLFFLAFQHLGLVRATCPASLILRDLAILIIIGEE